MEPEELLMSLKGMKTVWTIKAHIELNEKGEPFLVGFYKRVENGTQFDAAYKYVAGVWIEWTAKI